MHVEKTGDCLKLTVADELTIYTANECRDRILENIDDVTTLVIDLANVTEIDSAGLQLLMALNSPLVKCQAEFINHSAAVNEVLSLCGLAGQFGDAVVISAGTSQ